MCQGNESKKWVQEKISFTDTSFTDAISQGNAQTYGPIIGKNIGQKLWSMVNAGLSIAEDLDKKNLLKVGEN